ncbi:hypothetical protein bcgnr5406_53950 [Bacillus cereus]
MLGNIPITPISVFMMPKAPMVNINKNKLFRLDKKITPICNYLQLIPVFENRFYSLELRLG